ncbi:procollagen-lysine,2-oxoglutarate 5-dioxygenase-like [Planococcus citri]|uniref:procollagen-lysine,2-oxoglutarate 5-dioxygenase-like n=1 Tax=Planococcus citri TaxID=170843 RepID=UPI0031F7EEFA
MNLHVYLSVLLFSGIFEQITSINLDNYVENFKAFTVATNETDGYRQFIRSTKFYQIPIEVLGFGSEWKGGDMNGPGGAYKVNLLREAIKPYKDDKERIIIFTDSYDVLYLSPVQDIVSKFLSKDAGIVFSAEKWIWPSREMEAEYPDVKDGYRFLNSGGFIGYADLIYKLLDTKPDINNAEDDQLFYTSCYVNQELRDLLRIKLDHKAEIFQNLNGASGDIQLVPNGNKLEIVNIKYNTKPLLLHGNGYSKFVEFRTLTNYLAGRWLLDEGCKHCDESRINLQSLSISNYPTIVIAIFIQKPTPFIEEFLAKIVNQSYPKRKIHLFIHNEVLYHVPEIEKFIAENKEKYRSIKSVSPSDQIDTVTARNLAIDLCLRKSCDGYLNVDSDAHLDLQDTLASLVELNRTVAAPMLIRPFRAWSNFWGALDKNGYYKRSFDYMDIVNRKKRGLWNVPYISSCYLINATILNSELLRPQYSYRDLDYDMAFCAQMRIKDIYMHVDNRKDFGHLINLEGFDVTKKNPEVYELFANKWDWEQRYLNSEYHKNFEPETELLQPCPDVYWFPIVSERFCKEFIEIMENFGKWSDGSNNDTRLQGGYEAVPTRDIHMNQVGLHDHWLEFLKSYVQPLQQKIFIGYNNDPPRSLMNFVVRYKPDEQPSLRPHHDSSTYTINIALNRPNIDYEGGGCRFLRYDCEVTKMKLGWMLMHPGRFTHYHEGLLVTKGTRYIMISFVDP